MDDMFFADACQRSNRRIRMWYQERLANALMAAKEKGVREIDASISLAEKLNEALNEKVAIAKVVPLRDVEVFQDASLMKPIEPAVSDILHKSKKKGSTEKYLKIRYKKAPEDKFYFRVASNWDYGWQQKQSRVLARDVNRGRCAIIRDTFYRKNNAGPDPKHYSQPMGAEVSVCSEYQCSV